MATVGASTWVNDERGQTLCVALPRFPAVENEAAAGSLASPLPGKVLTVDVVVGDTVAAGAVVARLEAMKMEHEIRAPFAGTIAARLADVGDQVPIETPLMRIEAAEDAE